MSSQSGSAQGLPITNQNFLKAVFGKDWHRAHITGFAGDPRDPNLPRSVWEGGSASDRVLNRSENNYFAVSLFNSRRDQSCFDRLFVLAIDDVGPKVSADKLRGLPVSPTFRIETSPGNEQWGYVFKNPITDLAIATGLIDAMAKYVGINDARGVTRYIRLPVGSNGKATARGWQCRLLALSDEPEGNMAALAMVLSVGLTASGDDPGAKVVPGPGATRRSWDDLAEHDRWFRAMRKLDLVIAGPRNSAMGRCYDIVCPWVDEHTGRADSGTAYVPVIGRFECHHGHCAERTGADLPARLDALLRKTSPDLAKPMRLVDIEFDELPDAGLQTGSGSVLSANPGADIQEADPTEDGLARAFCDRYHGRLRFNRTTGHWHVWDKHTWAPDGSHIAFTWARQVTRDFRTAQERDIRALGKIAAAGAIERAARNDPRMSVTHDAFDKEPWRAGTPGDDVLLATGTSTPPDPANLVTRKLLVSPASKGTPAPVWDRFVWDTFQGDPEMIDFMHRWFGYSLSGDTSAEVFVFLYGTGGNGKGVLLHTVSAIAGDYAWKIDARVLMQRKHEGHETEVAQLAGKRMVITSELPDGASFNLTRLKDLTGNEGLLGARWMNKDHFQFRPVLKLTEVGNSKPQLDRVDNAIGRRTVLVPFLNRPSSPDPTLKARLVPEYPAILRRLVEGCAEVHATLAAGRGFHSLIPASVIAASNEYLAQQDVILLWMRERCEFDVTKQTLVTEVLDNFRSWCAEEGRFSPHNKQDFRDVVLDRAKNLGKTMSWGATNKGNVLKGLRLKI